MENSLEQIQLSVPGDGKYHLCVPDMSLIKQLLFIVWKQHQHIWTAVVV